MSTDLTPQARLGLDKLLADRGLGGGDVTTRTIGDGHSNLTYLVSVGDARYVLRRPPPPPTPPGAHDVLREARFLTALAPTPVPVAEVLATAQAGEVFDVPCYLMTFAAGPVVTTSTPAPLDTPQVRREIGFALVDTLADLHAVDFVEAGLADLGKPEGFNRRHLRSLSRLVADGQGELPGPFRALTAWLEDSVPAESGASIVHNDFRIGNLVMAPDAPGRIAAVLDWELATLGDPLFDLGYFLSTVPEHGQPQTPTEEFGTAMLEPGYPSRAELAERYAARTGRDLTHLAWYSALALWKLAVLYEYGRRRVHDGGDPYYRDPALVRSFLDAGHRVAGLIL